MENKNRWFIAVAAILTHLFLGTVYAWSFFQKPVSEAYGWTQGETAWAFSISNLMMGVTSAWCGAKLHQFKLKNLATMGAVLYGLGYIVSYFALKLEILPLLYIGFGFIGGIGNTRGGRIELVSRQTRSCHWNGGHRIWAGRFNHV